MLEEFINCEVNNQHSTNYLHKTEPHNAIRMSIQVQFLEGDRKVKNRVKVSDTQISQTNKTQMSNTNPVKLKLNPSP